MKEELKSYERHPIEQMIITVRGQRVILDADLARIYGVPTKRLNEQVRRNADRFPPDFAFAPTIQEVANLKSQIATSSSGQNRSQFATGSQRHRDPRFKPYAFTYTAAGVEKSQTPSDLLKGYSVHLVCLASLVDSVN